MKDSLCNCVVEYSKEGDYSAMLEVLVSVTLKYLVVLVVGETDHRDRTGHGTYALVYLFHLRGG